MKKILIFILSFTTLQSFAKRDFEKQNKAILEEGMRLYQSEKASWHGTDLFGEHYTKHDNIGGYFSYVEDSNNAKCIFFSKDAAPKVIGTISFDSTYNIYTAEINLTERTFTDLESSIYHLRQSAIEVISENKDGFFKSYENTNYNIIPLIYKKEKKVYIITGSQKEGVVFLGNDYLLSFSNNNQLKSKKKLHQSLIPFNHGAAGEEIKEAVHTHLPETGPLMTPTDICTLLLYAPFTKWKQHTVVSKDYVSIWTANGPNLITISTAALRKINANGDNESKK
ncbi:hypothetical protein DBR32_12995 [Taibaiella sp. KBW10]|uniref:hypothetical protein n=1 Tax=Taibaiella sp. KBW10 TaxID=2153357 RepID=UPI000F597CC1|nr:hypothetical protein [Taibaiella sp. KBW10]RQO30476.1 hypothetical protein DBR32_12995 [Taibaiella sp. KBW10]